MLSWQIRFDLMNLNFIVTFKVANKPIAVDEEVFVDYNYDTESSTGPHWEWYRELRQGLS